MVQVPRVGVPYVWHKPLTPQDEALAQTYLPVVCHDTVGWGFDDILVSSSPTSLDVILLSLIMEEAIHLVIFSAEIIPYVQWELFHI